MVPQVFLLLSLLLWPMGRRAPWPLMAVTLVKLPPSSMVMAPHSLFLLKLPCPQPMPAALLPPWAPPRPGGARVNRRYVGSWAPGACGINSNSISKIWKYE